MTQFMSKPRRVRTPEKKTYGQTGGLGVGGGLALVADENIDVREELLKLDLEELGDEGRAQVQHDGPALGAGGLGDLESGLDAVREEVALDVEELGVGDERGDLGRLQVRGREHLGGPQRRAQRAVVARNHDSASACLGRRGLHLVRRLDALGLVGLLERRLQVVVADRANVCDRAGGQDVSGSSGSVLRGTTGNIVDLGVSDNVVVAENGDRVSAGVTSIDIITAHMGICFSSARMASSALSSYLARYFSPSWPATWMSSWSHQRWYSLKLESVVTHKRVTERDDDRRGRHF